MNKTIQKKSTRKQKEKNNKGCDNRKQIARWHA